MIFHSHPNKSHFHKKRCTLGLTLKVSVLGTRKWPVISILLIFFFFCITVLVSLSGKQTGNQTEKFVGFIINIYNDFTDEPSGDFVIPLPLGVKEEKCHYEGRSYIVSRIHYIRRYTPVADPGDGPGYSPPLILRPN